MMRRVTTYLLLIVVLGGTASWFFAAVASMETHVWYPAIARFGRSVAAEDPAWRANIFGREEGSAGIRTHGRFACEDALVGGKLGGGIADSIVVTRRHGFLQPDIGGTLNPGIEYVACLKKAAFNAPNWFRSH